MKKLLLSLVALVLVAGACGGGSSSTAATVDGTEISRKDVIGVLDAAAKDPAIRAEVASEDEDADTSKSPKNYKAEVTATVLTNLIMFSLIDDELERNGITPTAVESGLDAYQAFTAKGEALQGDLQKLGEAYAAKEWSDADVEAYRSTFAGRYEEACTHHILVNTEDEAKAILGTIRSGTPFADQVSKSIDTGTSEQGGDVGCNAREGALVQEYTDAVAAAADGELIGPVKTEFGYHVILVDKTFAPRALDETLKADILAALAEVNSQIEWLARRADVTVDKRFGTWDAVTIQITPPAGATTTTNAPTSTVAAPSTTTAATATTAAASTTTR